MDNKIPHILIVDDDVNLLGTLRDILKMKGFEPVIAPTGAVALAQIEKTHFDLALIDLQLGDMSGLIILSAIKTRSPETECIMLTGHASQDTAIEAIQMGVYGYFQKPFDMEQVILSIQRALEKKQSAQALHNSEKRFRALIENGRDNISLLAADGTLLWESPSTKSTLGYAPDQFVGHNMFELLHLDDQGLIQELFAQLVQSPGKSQDSIFRLRHGDGTWRWIEATAANMLNEPSVQAIVINYRDITERKQAEEKIAQTEKRFRSLIENAPDGVVMVGLDGKYEYASPAALRIFGYSLEEIHGHNPSDDTHPEDLPMVLRVLQDLIANPSNVPTIQYRFKHSDSSWRWIESTFTNLLAEPSVEAIVINFRDITERKQAEESLRQVEANYRSIFENALEGIYQSLPEGRFITVNPAYARMLGYESPGELIETVTDIASQIYAKQAQRAEFIQTMAEHGSVTGFEFQMKRKDGGIIWISENVRAVCDDTGKILYYEGSVEDITERKRADEALRESEERYKLLADNVPDIIYSLDGAGNIVTVNSSAFERYGYTEQDSKGKPFINFIHPEDREIVINSFLQALAEQRKFTHGLQFRIVAENGVPYWFELNSQARFDGQGGYAGEEGVLRDITERKQAEEELFVAQNLYRLLAENSSDVISMIDAEGKVAYISPAYTRQLGYEAGELLFIDTPTILQQIHPDDRERIGFESKRGRELKLPSTLYAYRIKTKQGGYIWVEDILRREFDENGNIVRVIVNSRDITARKHVEDALRKSLHSLEEAERISQVGHYEIDTQSGKVSWSQEVFRIFGIDPAKGEPTVEEYAQLIHPQDSNALYEMYTQSATQGTPFDLVYRILRSNGEIRHVHSQAETARNEQGQITKLFGTFQDITERKQAEDTLLQRENLLNKIFDVLPVGIWLADKNGQLTRSNQRGREIWGAEPLVGQKQYGVFKARRLPSGEELAPEDWALAHTIKEGVTVLDEMLEIDSFDGKKKVILNFTAPVFDATGNVEAAVIINLDITERKKAEEALDKTRNDYQRLFNHANDVILIFEPEEEIILDVNAAACAIYGYSRDELIGMSLKKLTLDVRRGEAQISDTLRNGSYRDFESVHINKDGEKIYFLINASVVEYQNKQAVFSINHDITERKHADETLKESEERYRSIFDGVQDAIFIETKDGRISEVNYRACEMYGYSRDEFLKKTIRDLVPEGSDIFPLPGIQPNISSSPFETINRRHNGELFPIEISGRLQTINNEEMLLVIVRDITERKQADMALAQERNLLRTLIDILPDRIYVKDTETRFLLKNLADAHSIGTSPDEMVGKSDADYYPPDLAARYYADDQAVIQSGQPLINREEPTVGANNTLRWVLTTKVPWRDSEGRIIGLVGIGHDITERKQAEENIRQRVKELELLYASGLAFSQLLNPREIGQRIIGLLAEKMDWHHTTIRLIGKQDELELVAFDQPGLVDKAAIEAHFNKLITRIGEGLSGWALQQSKTIRIGDVSSNPHYVETSPGIHSGLYVPLKTGERVIGVISIEGEQPNAFSETDEQLLTTLANQAAIAFENARLFQTTQQEIIERKRVETLLADERNQLAQRVEERTADLSRVNLDLAHAVQVKDEFLASMSHELRTPLTGILGLSEVLQLRVYGELNDKQSSTLKTIEESGRHLLDLINDILDLSKIEAGKLELQFAPCSLADICLASLQLIKGMAQHKGQHVHYSPLPEPIVVRADARRLKQSLVNLLSNAIKFTPENGELGLEVEAIQSERKIKLTVWDKGIGIKPEDMNKLFKPFTQLDSGLAREYSGTGLGLSLVQHLTELHNGGIEMESKIGEGSRFTIILPWSPQNTTPIPYVQHPNTGRLVMPSNKFKAPLVMVVDDNETILQIVSDFLEAKQYRVITVRSGLELLERAAEHHPNIMLVDIQMPGISGLETIRRIRAHADPFVAATPVIAVTALAMPADREHCLQAGANDYISKPLKLKALAVAIQSLLERKQ